MPKVIHLFLFLYTCLLLFLFVCAGRNINGPAPCYQAPAVVTVNRRLLLKEVLLKLNQETYREDVQDIGGGIHVCELTVGLPPHRSFLVCAEKTFHGVSTIGCDEAVRNACDAALSYLVDYGLVIIDDKLQEQERT